MSHDPPHPLVHFLILSRCRVREHYAPKLRQCLDALTPATLWQLPSADAGRPIGGIVLHMLEHLQRHTSWIQTGSRGQNPVKLQDYFPTTDESPTALAERADYVITAWSNAMTGLENLLRRGEPWPPDVPTFDAVYHLVEHVSYHLGQVVVLTAKTTGHEFAFCQRGLNEANLATAVQAELASPQPQASRTPAINAQDFYASLAPMYHLIYPDWELSIQRQARALDSLIRETWPDSARQILDVSCGIGTQAIGLAQLGYEITASDLSPEEVERARQEAARRNVKIDFSVADMRECFTHHARQFDVVISCDNSIAHLLTDSDILQAFKQFAQCTRPGGGCLVSVRDYEQEDLSRQQIKPYGLREQDGVRWLLWQVWDPHGPLYDATLYLLEDRAGQCRTHAFRSTCYAVKIPQLIDLMSQAGFKKVRRVDNRFFQPIILGIK